MYSTTPPLLHELRKVRKSNKSATKDTTSQPGVLGSNGRFLPHFGPNFEPLGLASHPARQASDDWLFGAPTPTNFSDPYSGDEHGMLIREHPNVIGTPKAALITRTASELSCSLAPSLALR